MGGPVSKKCFKPSRPQFGLKIGRGGGGVGESSLEPPVRVA